MCDYCDCRELAPIGELSEEHAKISALAHRLRRELSSTSDAAASTLSALKELLAPHLAKEEIGLFSELARRDGFRQYLGELLADHAKAREQLLAADCAQPAARAMLLEALDDLERHIETEEYDLFPASRLILDDLAWSKVMAKHHPEGVIAATRQLADGPGADAGLGRALAEPCARSEQVTGEP